MLIHAFCKICEHEREREIVFVLIYVLIVKTSSRLLLQKT